MPPRKPTPRASKRAADVLFSKAIRTLRDYRCEACGRQGTSNIQCAHWLSRRYSWTRTDWRNAFCLCAGCHRKFTDNPTMFSDWAIAQSGRGTYELLVLRSQLRVKFDWIEEVKRWKRADPYEPPAKAEYGNPPILVTDPWVYDSWWSPSHMYHRHGLRHSEDIVWVWHDGQPMTVAREYMTKF